MAVEGITVAKKDKEKKDKKLKKSSEVTPVEAVETDELDGALEVTSSKGGSGETPSSYAGKSEDDSVDLEEETVIEVTGSKGGSGKTSSAVLTAEEALELEDGSVDLATGEVLNAPAEEAPKARAKRAPKKVEIPESSLEFVAEFPVEDILPRERNTRFRGKETERVLSQMIQRFGWTQPLTLDAEHRIVDGQYRLELATKWGVKTVPVVITGGLSVAAGTTDIFHMLANRIIEWDKWNYPATDAVLKSVDGGLGTETILDFETTSEVGPLRDLAREIGWFIEVIPKSLSGSTVTLETLAGLLKKSLAGKYHYDPAQLLYIEALREQLEATRREMVANGETAGGVKPKLEQHIGEEARKLAEGEAIAKAEGYEMVDSEDGKTKVFTADPEIAYVVTKVAIAEEAAKVQVRSAQDMQHRFREMADGKKMGLTQFRILASYFSDMTPEEASDFFNGTAAEKFNAFVDSVLEENRTISANRSKNFPLTDAELKTEQYRLRGEDIRKETEKAGKDAPKGLSSFLVDDLKALLKLEGLPLSGKKADLVARLEEAGYGVDGTKGEATVPASEAEEAELTAEEEPVEVAEDELTEDFDDSPMIFTADSTEESSAVAEIEEEEAVAAEPTVEESVEDAVAELEAEAEAEEEAEAEKLEVDIKALKKRGKELKALAEERELSKAELKEFKAIKKQLKAAKD